jgi:Ca-activated chloride channel family protein
MLKDRRGNCAILQGVTARGRLAETLASIEVEQRYLNPLKTNIEAVYTFPLPIGAVLLDMTVEIAGKKLVGQVVEKKAAEKRYEEAITDGDSAVMVEETGNGLFTMNVGNLLAGEAATIRYRYAMTLAWQGDRLRFLIPTTIAPRYGNAEAAGLKPWQVPETSFLVEYPFDLSILVEGELANCEIGSTTHNVSVSRIEEGMEVRLANSAMLDRDFVLTARTRETVSSTVTMVQDGDQHVAFASLRIPDVQLATDAPLCLKVVIDCSGSMAGTSISQARKAALSILDLLRPKDTFNVTLYGNHHENIFPSLVPGEPGCIELARQRLLNLDADMGGTETGNALESAYKLSGDPKISFERWISDRDTGIRPAILLITDGEIWDYKKIISRAKKSGHRIFTVGVGFSVAEGFVKDIATESGAACELVAPQEGMSERILAQFHRLRQPKLDAISLSWDTSPAWQTAIPDTIFAGDTLNIFAGFGEILPKSVALSTGQVVSVNLAPKVLPDVPRLAAHAMLQRTESSEEKLALALKYQLLTPQTNYLVIAERAEKTEDLPGLVKVEHMLAAGWGGAGDVLYSPVREGAVQYCVSSSHDAVAFSSGPDYSHLDVPAVLRCRTSSNVTVEALANSGVDRYDIPAFLRNQSDGSRSSNRPVQAKTIRKLQHPHGPDSLRSQLESTEEPTVFIQNLNKSLAHFLQTQVLPDSVDELVAFGLPELVARGLVEINARHLEERVVLAFLYALAESSLSQHFERGLRRLILSAWKKMPNENSALMASLAGSMASIQADEWNWNSALVSA